MEKLKSIIFSRKFLALIVSVVAFFLSDKFNGDHLVVVIGIYCGTNAISKFAEKNNE